MRKKKNLEDENYIQRERDRDTEKKIENTDSRRKRNTTHERLTPEEKNADLSWFKTEEKMCRIECTE